MSTNTKLIVGMVGGGTVGGGVYDILHYKKRQELLKMGVDIVVKKICVQNLNKKRDIPLESHTKYTDNIHDILNDPEINCVVELCGGTGTAKDIIYSAIASNKHVVTANKALISKNMDDLIALLKKHPKVFFGYEAAVGGGIPCISTLRNSCLGDEITRVAGIMNGTTNFILSKMDKEAANYEDVLKEAQALGFAEAEPSADVDGYDIRSKICVLAKLAYGCTIKEENVMCVGITRVTADDFAYAKLLNSAVKILGVANKVSADTLEIYVSPVLVPKEDVISTINGATNIIQIFSSSMIATSLVGSGAGRYPTANSVVSDLVNIAKGQLGDPFPLDTNFTIASDIESQFYIRINVRDQVGIIRTIGEVCEKYGVSICSIQQTPIIDKLNCPFVVTTDKAKHSVSGPSVRSSSPSSASLYATVSGPMKWEPSIAERPYYDALFLEADISKSQRIAGKEAVEFLQRSSLPINTLKEIWNMCENKTYHFLDRDGFALACRLIALAQENISITPGIAESTASKQILPKFQGITVPTLPSPISTYSLPPSTTNPGSSPINDQWAMSAEEAAKYSTFFTNYDTDGDGYITGQEAAAFFQKSGAKTDDLRAVWNLSDMDKDGRLNLVEFSVAMHLTVKIVKLGLPCPEILPPSVLSALVPSTPMMTSKETVKETEIVMTSVNNNMPDPILLPTVEKTQQKFVASEEVHSRYSTPTAPLQLPTTVVIEDTSSAENAIEQARKMNSYVKPLVGSLDSLKNASVKSKMAEHLSNLKSEISEMTQQISNASASFKSEVGEIEEIVNEIEELSITLNELRAKRDLQLELINEEKGRRPDLTSKRITILNEINNLNSQIEDLQSENSKIQGDVHASENKNLKIQNSIKEVQNIESFHKKAINDNNKEIEMLEKILSSSKISAQRLSKENNNLKETLNISKSEGTKQQAVYESKVENLTKVAENHEATSKKKAALSEKLKIEKKSMETIIYKEPECKVEPKIETTSQSVEESAGFSAFPSTSETEFGFDTFASTSAFEAKEEFKSGFDAFPPSTVSGFETSGGFDAFSSSSTDAFSSSTDAFGSSSGFDAFGSSTTDAFGSSGGFDAFSTTESKDDKGGWGF